MFELKRKHAGNVQGALDEIRDAIDALVKKRDERRDSFAGAIKTAMQTRFGADADEVVGELRSRGIGQRLADEAVQLVPAWSEYSLFAIVDALTRIAGRSENAGDRLIIDQQAASLLSMAA